MWFSSTKVYSEEYVDYYFLTVKELKRMFSVVKSWRMNRPPDIVRVEMIKNHFILDKVKVVPGQVCCWINERKELEIYDGIHRFLSSSDDMFIYVKIMKSDMDTVVKDFKNINMSVSVPELYLTNSSNTKKEVCEKLAEKLCSTFPDCRSASRNPQPQNFNRDNMIELFSSLDCDFYIQNLDIKLWAELLGLNMEAKNYVAQHKIKTPKKCDYYKFWLLYLPRDYIKTKLEESVRV